MMAPIKYSLNITFTAAFLFEENDLHQSFIKHIIILSNDQMQSIFPVFISLHRQRVNQSHLLFSDHVQTSSPS